MFGQVNDGLDIANVLDSLYPSFMRDKGRKMSRINRLQGLVAASVILSHSKKPWLSQESRLKHDAYHSPM